MTTPLNAQQLRRVRKYIFPVHGQQSSKTINQYNPSVIDTFISTGIAFFYPSLFACLVFQVSERNHMCLRRTTFCSPTPSLTLSSSLVHSLTRPVAQFPCQSAICCAYCGLARGSNINLSTQTRTRDLRNPTASQ